MHAAQAEGDSDPPGTRRAAGTLTPTASSNAISDLNHKVTGDCRRPAESVVFSVVTEDARREVLDRLERAWMSLLRSGRLDLVAEDLSWCVVRLTTTVDRQLDTAERVLDRPFETAAAA